MRNYLTITCVAVFLLGCQAKAVPTEVSKPAGTIPLNGVEGRVDHMALDVKNGRLYVAALGNNTVEVIDVKAAKKVAQITGLKKPQGVAVLPDSSRLVVASGEDGKVRVYDDHQKLVGTVDGLDDADNVRYDPEAKLLYVGYGDGALAVIDAEKLQKVGDIKLEGHPESFQLEAKGIRIFVNVPDAGHVAVVDRAKRTVVAKWPVEPARANYPMALDEQHHSLFVGCRKPSTLLVLNTETGKAVATLDGCGDTDDVFYDAAKRRVYMSGGEGWVSIIEQTDANTYRHLGKITTAAGARTSILVATDGLFYVAVPRRSEQKCELRVFNMHE